MTCQGKCINCNKPTTQVGDVDSRGASVCGGESLCVCVCECGGRGGGREAGVIYGKSLCFFLSFAVNLKLP